METQFIFAFSVSIISVFLYGRGTGLVTLADNTGQTIEYVYYTETLSWNEARNVCHSIGGELAKVDSQQTIDDIKQLALDEYPGEALLSDDFWIGLYDTVTARRQFALDCTELTFTSNYLEEYFDKEPCFKLRAGLDWEGYSRACDEATPFLCEVHLVGTCSFRYEIQDVSAVSVSGVNNYGVCEDHCAYDVTCSGALYVSPSVCYKLPYNTSTTAQAMATVSSKFCASFRKNTTIVSVWENRSKYPTGDCGIIPINGSTVGNVSELSPSSYPTTSIALTSTSSVIAPSSSVIIEQPSSTLVVTEIVTSAVTAIAPQSSMITEPCSTLVITELVTSAVTANVPQTSTIIEPCSTVVMTELVTSVVTDMATVTQVQMTTLQPSMSPCICTASPETTTEIHTLIATATLTEIDMTTVEVVQQCTPQTYTSPVTVHVTATPSCALPIMSVPPSITTPPPPIITNEEAQKVAEEISKNLTVDVKTTSMYLRSLVCARDERTTSQAVGAVGIVCIVVPLTLVMAADFKGILTILRAICLQK